MLEARETPDPARPRPTEDALKAVSAALALKKPALDRPPTASRAGLPDFPGVPGSITRRLAKGPALQAKFREPLAALGPPPVPLPEGPRTADTPPGDPPGFAPTVGVGPGVDAASPGLSPTPAAGVERPAPAVAAKIETVGDPTRPGGGQASVAGPAAARHVAPAPPVSRADGATPGPAIGGGPAGPDPGKAASASPPGGFRVGGAGRAVDPPGMSGPPSVVAATPSIAAEDRPAPGPPAASRPVEGARGAAAPARPGANLRLDVATVGVRTPPSDGLRNVALATATPTVGGGVAPPDLGRSGPDAAGPFSGAASSQPSASGGAAVDLSRTNELLQQLLDAVRRQRVGSLPAGGPSVYADR